MGMAQLVPKQQPGSWLLLPDNLTEETSPAISIKAPATIKTDTHTNFPAVKTPKQYWRYGRTVKSCPIGCFHPFPGTRQHGPNSPDTACCCPHPLTPRGQQNVLQWSRYRSRSSERWCLTSLLPHSPVGDESSSRQKCSRYCWLTYLHHCLIAKDRFAAPVLGGWDHSGTSKLAPDPRGQKDGHPN